jgi:hypothetical protein
LDATFWDKSTQEWLVALQPELEAIYLERAREVLQNQTVGVDWALVNENAAKWAKEYGFELVKGINDNTRAGLQNSVSQWFEKPTTLGDLRESIAPLFGPVRSEMIAITEVTRASTMGENAVVDQLAEQGVEMKPFWHTSNDKDVCEEYCAPANGKAGDEPISDGAYGGSTWTDLFPDGPPAHPRCRCAVGHRLVTDGE